MRFFTINAKLSSFCLPKDEFPVIFLQIISMSLFNPKSLLNFSNQIFYGHVYVTHLYIDLG
jgi:hypothetical protein